MRWRRFVLRIVRQCRIDSTQLAAELRDFALQLDQDAILRGDGRIQRLYGLVQERDARFQFGQAFFERRMLGKTVLYFERPELPKLAALGEVHTPSVADLFVAKLSRGAE